MRFTIWSCAALAAALPAGLSAAADATRGKALYEACAACHTDRPEAVGPSLRSVAGRKSAAIDDYRYSNPMKRANRVWDETNLRAYLWDPQAKVKGNRMPFGAVREPADIDDVIAHRKSLK